MQPKECIRARLEKYPRLYLNLLRLKRRRHWSLEWVLTPQHDVVIEGFPRSANSFALKAFAEANAKNLLIATHTHSPAQIVQAVKWNIPTMVLLREPVAAVTGLLAFSAQLRQMDGKPIGSPSSNQIQQVASRWLFFYTTILPIRDRIFIARFDQVTTDFGAVSERFIEFAQKPWQSYDPAKIPERSIMDASHHIGPTQERNRIKERFKQSVMAYKRRSAMESLIDLYRELGHN